MSDENKDIFGYGERKPVDFEPPDQRQLGVALVADIAADVKTLVDHVLSPGEPPDDLELPETRKAYEAAKRLDQALFSPMEIKEAEEPLSEEVIGVLLETYKKHVKD